MQTLLLARRYVMRKVIIANIVTTADDYFTVTINQFCKGLKTLNTSHDTVNSVFTGTVLNSSPRMSPMKLQLLF